jgi:hypothetical protein
MNFFPTLPCDPAVLLLALTVHVLRLVGTYLSFYVVARCVMLIFKLRVTRVLSQDGAALVLSVLEFFIMLALLVVWVVLNWASLRYLYHVITLPV